MIAGEINWCRYNMTALQCIAHCHYVPTDITCHMQWITRCHCKPADMRVDVTGMLCILSPTDATSYKISTKFLINRLFN
jgi:hypothetical protein